MTHRIAGFSAQTQLALKVASCLGLRFELELLARVCEVSTEMALAWLQEAVKAQLLLPVPGAARVQDICFAQAKVREAAAALPITISLPEVHLRAGRVLWQQAIARGLEPQLFGTVDHFNQAQMRLQPTERPAVAELNLRAGLLALGAGEYQTAANYFQHGLDLLHQSTPPDPHLQWELGTRLAECEAALRQTPQVPGPQPNNTMLRAQLDANRRLVQQQQQELLNSRTESDAALHARAEFLSHMGHEVRNPLNAIVGLSHLALKREADPGQRAHLQQINQSGQHLLAVLNDLLDYSRVEAGQMAMEIIPFELDTVFETLAGLCAEKAQGKGLELIWHIAPAVPRSLVGDPMRLGQILIHYTRNALRFTTLGEVEVAVDVLTQTPDLVKLRFEIRDTGVGLSPEQIAGLYASDRPSDAARRHGRLGLAVIRRMVTLMGGEVGVHSQPGQGSTFWFSANLGLSGARARRVLATTLRHKRVLVVDDNANAAAVLCEQLLTLGCMAHGLVSGQAALAELRRAAEAGEPYDLLMTDWQMPEMDGMELVQRVNASALRPAPLKVLVTAYGTDSAGPQAAQSGIAHLLQKPVSQSTLFDALAGLFGGHAAGAAVQSRATAAAVGALLDPVRGARILLVEDNPSNQQLAREILQSEGFVVALADNGQQAIVQVRQSTRARCPFDLVLMDMQMPVLDGVSAAHLIRSMPEYAKLPIVAMSANSQQADRQLCLRAGMNDFVCKPIDPLALWQALARWISLRPGLGEPLQPSGQAVAMQTLRAYLQDDDVRALELFQCWRLPLQKRLGDGCFQRAEALLHAFDLEAALALLQDGGAFNVP